MDVNSKIFVAGHNGLVGSAIYANLIDKGYKNVIVKPFESLNLIDQKLTEDFFRIEKPEYVFLAAAKVGGIFANNNFRAEFIYENLMIQSNVIHNAWKYGVKKLLFLGSTCIYPKDANQPMHESELLKGILEYTNEPYAIAKIAGIKMCESYNLQYGTNFISVMPTNLYGPNDNFDLEKSHVLPALLRKLLLGKYLEDENWNAIRRDLNNNPIEGVNGKADRIAILGIMEKYGIKADTDGQTVLVEIWGSGKPKREFMWSEEMADACVYVMENVNFTDEIVYGKQTEAIEVRNTHINIGTGEEISIKELAKLIKTELGFGGKLHFNSSKPDGVMRKVTNVERLNSLGWKYQVPLKTGVQRLLRWYKSKSK